ncbi:hypothetical protein GCM10028791_40070 [Echinicola sediminis]
MKKSIYLLLFLIVTLSSCIEWGLEDLPEYDEASIIDFDFEHRFVSTNDNGVEKLSVVTLNSSLIINQELNQVVITATIPEATSNFPESERKKVSLASIIGYAKLSPAASIKPVAGAPELGKPGDFSQERRYIVTAADGTSREWLIQSTLE